MNSVPMHGPPTVPQTQDASLFSQSRKVIRLASPSQASAEPPSTTPNIARCRPKNPKNAASRPTLPPRQLSKLPPMETHLMSYHGMLLKFPCWCCSFTDGWLLGWKSTDQSFSTMSSATQKRSSD